MFGLSNLQIYGLQTSEVNGMKVTANIFDKFIKSEMVVGADCRKHFDDNRQKNNNNITTGLEKIINGHGFKERNSIDSVDGNKETEIVDKNSNQVMKTSTPKTTAAGDVDNVASKITPEMQKRKYMQMISFLDQQNQHLEKELAKEKRRRADELSRIIKSLLCFEAKLKHDKKVINQKLFEKDTEICKLVSLNKVLREKCCAAGQDLDESAYPEYQGEALFCPSCRKKFYGIDHKENWSQTNKDARNLADDHMEHGSSSDETMSSFYGARRSIRYTSRRFGTFRDYMRSRSMNIDYTMDNSEENTSTLSRDESREECQYSFGKNNPFSSAIDRLHGVRRVESFDADLDSENSDTLRKAFSSGPEDENSIPEDDVFVCEKENSCSAKEFAEISPKQEFEMSTDDWYASASDPDDNDVRAKPYAYNAVNPVLECVNQILLQQSMGESLHDGPPSLESNENNSGSGGSNKDGTVSRKRVHFSTKNSMVHVPRDDATSPSPILSSADQKDSSFNYESIYGNEYEPIGSEQNSSNLYVDMESKTSQDDRIVVIEKPKQPPALPPKPANLMKFKRVLRILPQPCLIKKPELKAEEKTPSEPDYCSISEVNEAITSVQIVVDVHKVPEDDFSSSQSDSLSQKTEDAEEIFADIPKLPNVAAIIAPKVITKFISHDNYITKSPSPKDEIVQKQHNHPHPQQYMPNILAEINKKITTSSPTTPTKAFPPTSPSKKIPSPCIKVTAEDKLPLQAEFDWYNLDAEYGKSNQPDVIKATDVASLEYAEEMGTVVEGNGHSQSVEYNLDEEFSLSNQPDIIKENVLETKSAPPSTICEGFPTIVEPTPTSKLKVKTNFSAFIDNSGLSTKPLPRQRKIYFSGPFV